MSKGKVWLVGAGPGDRGLLTVKGKEILMDAEVVVYDQLVGQGILQWIPEAAEAIDAGKRAGHHTMKQEDTNRLLLEKALEGKRVVRLKGGDPFLFGRGAEELVLLVANEIPYEIVPGITSALAVPGYSGIPVTHRDLTSSLHIIAGHRSKNRDSSLDFETLVKTDGTLVFLMGLGALTNICQGLMAAGMAHDMPAAVIQKGTTWQQKRVVATLETLEKDVAKAQIMTPAIIVVGKVCALAHEFAWFEHQPLAGMRILVTRPKTLNSTLSKKLMAKGADVLELPTIRIEPVNQAVSYRSIIEAKGPFAWIVFTSPSGVDVFFETMKNEKLDLRVLNGVRIAAMGPGTTRKIEERGIMVDYMPETYDGISLGQGVGLRCQTGDCVWVPRARFGNEEIVQAIKAYPGLKVYDMPTYDTTYEVPRIISPRREIEKGHIDYAVFTSKSTVKGFVEATAGLDYSQVKAICIGHQTNEAAEAYGMTTWVASEATIDSLVATIESLAVKGDREENNHGFN